MAQRFPVILTFVQDTKRPALDEDFQAILSDPDKMLALTLLHVVRCRDESFVAQYAKVNCTPYREATTRAEDANNAHIQATAVLVTTKTL